MGQIRLLITGDDSSSRRGLMAIFTSEKMFDVLGCFSLEEATEKSLYYQPDVILFELTMDIVEHEQKISQIKNECPYSLIIALIENEQLDKLASLLEKGIDGCLPKGIMRGCLVKTVELACLAGIFCLPGSTKKMISFIKTDKTVNLNEFSDDAFGSGDLLTKREMEILQLMAQNSSNRDIAKTLFISEPTVKTHVSSILRKLGQNNRAQAIVFSYKTGLIKNKLNA